MRMSILGGSSPFTAGLFEALSLRPRRVMTSITLYGRNSLLMAQLCKLGAALCPDVAFDWTCDLRRACTEYDMIVNQIRFGGLTGREADERFAIALGAPPDESIGPAGLNRALAMKEDIVRIAASIQHGSPNAHVVNLTNPLGLSTSLLWRAGVARPIGLCELPMTTAAEIAHLLGCGPERLTWYYSGLNHRGFLHHLAIDGQDVLPMLPSIGEGADFGGLTADEAAAFGAIPTKYFRLFSVSAPISPPGRAAALGLLRDQIEQELYQDPLRLPPSLSKRSQPWWQHAFVPLVESLVSDVPVPLVLNLPDAEGLTRELRYMVSARGIETVDGPQPPATVSAWISRFEDHERACLRAVEYGEDAAIAAAHDCDPLLNARMPGAVACPNRSIG